MKKLIVVLTLVLLSACSSKVLKPAQSDADRGSAKFPGLTVAELNEGRTLFQHKCTQCHLAKKPSSRDAAGWKEIVPQMAARASRKNKEEINKDDQDKILKYLITMSRHS